MRKSFVLNEKIKAKLLEGLMRKELSFSELLKLSNLRDHGQLNYHIKELIKEGLVSKKNKTYFLTNLGERMGVYLNQFQLKEIYPLSVVCGIIYDDRGRILLLRRAKNPQKDNWGFPGGKLRIGETIDSAVQREVFEEIGVKIKAKKTLGFFPSLVYKNKQLSFHANIIPVLMDTFNGKKEVKITKEHSNFKFVELKDLKKYALIANNQLILDALQEPGFVFKEIIFNES